MRQGQQNRRGRGRNNGNAQNRKGQNPLARSFESAGPDVKLRGTPAHIAEKYMALARDAQSAGDPVLAENYLQHAEHYNRIILTYREQQAAHNGADGQPPMPRHRNGPQAAAGDAAGDEAMDDDATDDATAVAADGVDAVGAPQPSVGRPERGGRSGQDRPQRRGQRGERAPRAPRGDSARAAAAPQPDVSEDANGTGRRDARGQGLAHHEQPEFLRRPVRRSRRDAAQGGDGAAADLEPTTATTDGGAE